jgi:hypothetical protein
MKLVSHASSIKGFGRLPGVERGQSKDVSSSQKGPCAVCLIEGIFLS